MKQNNALTTYAYTDTLVCVFTDKPAVISALQSYARTNDKKGPRDTNKKSEEK